MGAAISKRPNSEIVFGMLLGAAGGAGASIWRAARGVKTWWDAPMLVDRGLASLGGNDRVALACFGEAIRLDPASAPYHRDRGDLRPSGSAEELADYDEAVRLDPGSSEVRTRRGRSHQVRRDLDRAIADYTEALRLRPGDLSALTGRSVAHRDKEDYGRHKADEAEIRRATRA